MPLVLALLLGLTLPKWSLASPQQLNLKKDCPTRTSRVVRLVNDSLINPAGAAFFKGLIRLRYTVTTEGLDQIPAAGGGILFLPNHPGWTDPAIQYTNLFWRYRAQPVGYEGEVNRKGIFGMLIRRTNPLVVPDATKGGAEDDVEKLAEAIAEALAEGKNILMYPEGQLSRTLPDLNGRSLVERILKIYPQARIVLSQMNGHLGSSLGAMPTGDFPDIGTVVPRRMLDLARAGVFFMPRRPIHVKYEEVTDVFPKNGTRVEINEYLNRYYRDGLLPPRYIPYRRSEPPTAIDLPYPAQPVTTISGDMSDVPALVREQVVAKIRELTGIEKIGDEDSLAATLGMDSLDHQSLNLWIETTFKVHNNAPISTVKEALLIAAGKQATTGARVRPPDGRWVRDQGNGKALTLPPGVNDLLEAFRVQCAKNPDRVVVTDLTSGPMTYRDLAMAIKLFIPRIKKMEGKYVGLMMPASVGSVVAFYATLFAGKTPVVLNFTSGEAKIKYSLDSLGVKSILTAQAFVDRLAAPPKNTRFSTFEDRYVTFERIREGIGTQEKLAAMLWSETRGFWQGLPYPTLNRESESVVLFTSGSKSNPKAVPYNHGMEMVNIADVAKRMGVTDSDRVMTIAPPFHSLGHRLFTAAVSLGMPQVFYPDPTDGVTIAKVSEYYRPTLIVGTPTFLRGIAWSAEAGQLDSYRLGLMGAEKLTDDVIKALAEKAPRMVLAEGYGSTELGPVVAVNPPDSPRYGTIGTAMDSVDIRIVDPDDFEKEVPVGQAGMMLVAPKNPLYSSVMTGYLNYEGTQPFRVLGREQRKWFVTGDLVMRLEGDYFKFISRLERSVKIGGEMVPLDGLEETLQTSALFASTDGEGPTVAVEATPVDVNPDLVLFTTKRGVTTEQVNEILRAGGWSRTFKILRLIELPTIPQLGTGKIDRQPMRERLKN